MAAKKKIQFCKNVTQCPSCLLMTDIEADPDDEDVLSVTCSLELNKGAEEIEGDSCPSYQAGMNPDDVEDISEEDVKEIIKAEDGDDKVYEETKKMYTYRGDNLIELVKTSSGQTSYMLYPSYVEFYNLQVHDQKQAIQDEVDRIQGRLTTVMNALRNMMVERGEDVGQDDVLMITAPDLFVDDDELSEEDELIDAEMAVPDDEGEDDEELEDDEDEEDEFEDFEDEDD